MFARPLRPKCSRVLTFESNEETANLALAFPQALSGFGLARVPEVPSLSSDPVQGAQDWCNLAEHTESSRHPPVLVARTSLEFDSVVLPPGPDSGK